ncbi:hypothetical protein QYE76_034113 [Lolium multiflorum]|uniref:Uncharacterized protein n=1 Tax=Lolium multiflorum TaxID=4521 RepID=A0AAD8QWH7_LOLMU|nr:hypothetical protein QYE76_034113 [Lolium multiflorum]
MLPQGKNIFCTVIKYATFPDGYASNLYHKVNLEDKRLTGLKSHDCHIIMQDLMPLALCRSLPRSVAMPLIRFCKYFKVLYGTKMLESQERRMSMLNHKLKKLNVPTRDVQPSELISNEMERIALMKEAIAKGVYYDMLEALINERFQQNPALVGEPHMDGDLYSELFTPPRNCRRHGFGLLVGGKGSKVLDEAVEALRDSKEENIELRGYVETLMARSQQLEEKVNYLMARQRDGHTDEMQQEREEAVAEELAASTLAELSTHKQAPPEQEQAKEASSAAGRTISASASRASGITSAPSSSHNTMKVPTATTLKSTSAPFKSPFKAPGKGAAYAEKTVQGSATACDQKTEPATVLGSKATTAAAKIPKAGRSAKGSTINGSEAASIPTIPEAAGAANGSTIALKASAAAAAARNVPEASGASNGSTTINGSKAAPKGSGAAAHKLAEAAGSVNGSTTALSGSEAAASAPRKSTPTPQGSTADAGTLSSQTSTRTRTKKATTNQGTTSSALKEASLLGLSQMLPPKSKAVTAISEQGQEMKSPITSKRRRNGSQGNVESQAKTAATPTETISKRQKKRKIEELVDDKLEELNDDVVITSVSVVQKPKCSYRNLLDNTLLVKVKEEKLEENIADKEGDWHSTKRCTDEHNDWFRARNPLKGPKGNGFVQMAEGHTELCPRTFLSNHYYV